MITPHSFSRDWIEQVSKEQKAQKGLVEKLNRALLLLEGLAESMIPFVFKGGTALILHFKGTRRLSIDIDIVVEEKIDLMPVLKEIASKKGFDKIMEQERQVKGSMEKSHYKFYYTSVLASPTEQNILLDVLFSPHGYAKIISLPITVPFLHQEDKFIEVPVASLEDLLGDKMTAFAPNTTGIPYAKNEISTSMEIIKQLYDIGHLFDSAEEFPIVANTFRKLAAQQISYRDLNIDIEQVLDDIHDTAIVLSTKGMDGFKKEDYGKLSEGVSQVSAYIFSESYHIEKAIVHASKAAYLAGLIRKHNYKIKRYADPVIMKDWLIESPFPTKINKLKKTNQEAFFYWYQVYLLQQE